MESQQTGQLQAYGMQRLVVYLLENVQMELQRITALQTPAPMTLAVLLLAVFRLQSFLLKMELQALC